MPKAVAGTMIQCDPAILAIVERINQEHSHAFIRDRLDDEHLLVDSGKIHELKGLLSEVCLDLLDTYVLLNKIARRSSPRERKPMIPALALNKTKTSAPRNLRQTSTADQRERHSAS